MAIWSGLGINYGSVSRAATSFSTDLAYLRALGFTKIRLSIVDYSDLTNITAWRSYALQACNLGFTEVIYGITAITTGITSANIAAFNTALATEATWAQSINKSNLTLELGNEEETHHDGSLTDAQVRANMRTVATTCKAIYTTGQTCYCSSNVAGALDAWISEGRGSFDKLGFNIYDDLATIVTDTAKIVANFGTAGFISEWNRPNALSQTLGNNRDAIFVANQLALLKASGLASAYFFTYYFSGTFYGIFNTLGTIEPVWPAVLEKRRWLT